jgi:hypothetical protein
VLLIVGHSSHRGLGLLCEGSDEIDRRRDPVADQEDHRPGFEAAHRLAHVTDWEHADAVEPESLKRVLQRLRYAFDHDHDRRRSGGGGTTDLIFDEGAPSERKQGAQTTAIIFLIGPDQRADRHILRHPPLISRNVSLIAFVRRQRW